MRRMSKCALVLMLAAAPAVAVSADVKTKDKTQFKLEGMLGRMVGMFGGKAAREGIVGTTAVKGDRKIDIDGDAGRIIDLGEEKVYELDFKKKTYTVVTFEELRRQMREAEEKARREAGEERGERGDPEKEQEKPAKEYEVDFEVKETGQKKSLAGYDTRQVIAIVTVREKGRTLEDSGGMVLTMDSWLGPEVAALKELAEFDLKYAKALNPEMPGISAQQMAAIVALYPMFAKANERLREEGEKLRGTPLMTTTTLEAVKGKEQLEQEKQSGGGGGLGGMLARRMMKKEEKPRATVFTLMHETLELTTNVAADELAVPAGFKQKTD